MKFFVVLVLTVLLPTCFGLKCHICENASSESNGDCTGKNEVEKDCDQHFSSKPPGTTFWCRLVSGSTKKGRKQEMKNCVTPEDVKREDDVDQTGCSPFDKYGIKGTLCVCDKDLCNKGDSKATTESTGGLGSGGGSKSEGKSGAETKSLFLASWLITAITGFLLLL